MSDYELANEILTDENADEKQRQVANDLITYKALFDNINGGGFISTVATDCEFLFVSDGLLRLFGKDEKSFIEMTENNPANILFPKLRNRILPIGQFHLGMKFVNTCGIMKLHFNIRIRN